MRVFGTDSTSPRGCFMAFDVDTVSSGGAVVRLPQLGQDIQTLPNQAEGRFNYPLVAVNVAFSQKELVAFLQCFGSRIYTYTFGADLGDLSVSFVGFLSGGRSKVFGQDVAASEFSKADVVNDFLTAYKQSRVSASRKLAKVSLGSGACLQGFIIGMDSSTMAVETNLQAFNLKMKLVEVQGAQQTGGGEGTSQQSGAQSTPQVTLPYKRPRLATDYAYTSPGGLYTKYG